MLVRELAILNAHADLKYRDCIYKAWLLFLEGGEDSVELANYYHYLKHHIGLRLPSMVERELVAKSALYKRGDVSVLEMKAAEVYGLFEGLDPSFSKWQAVVWGRLACKRLFAEIGVNGSELLEALDLHLIRGQRALGELPEGANHVHELVISGRGVEEIAMATGKSKALIFACIWHLAA